MRRRLAARTALVGLVIYGVARVLDPEARWGAAQVGGDRIEHALLVFGLLTCLLGAFPRLSAPVAAGGMLGLGLLVEALQATPLVPGSFQLADVAADVVGVALAILPVTLGRAGSGRAGEPPSPS